ncbi:MAG: hypothetical protein KKH74_01510 [Gammaproteobacteria bacterium]|nr:hypothetical protein [Gammaproteobacteria bacterium]MBU1732501.1 hypothetical protein [Gammaproteobacteria bacterium]MBU1892637.1 hypothetical protein [Gammaproteobacteria bacterium]
MQAQQRAERYGAYVLKRGAEMRGQAVDWWTTDEMLAQPEALEVAREAVAEQRAGGQLGEEYLTLSAYLASGKVHNEDAEYARFRYGILMTQVWETYPEECEQGGCPEMRLTAGGWERWIDTGEVDTSASAETRQLTPEEWRSWVMRGGDRNAE